MKTRKTATRKRFDRILKQAKELANAISGDECDDVIEEDLDVLAEAQEIFDSAYEVLFSKAYTETVNEE